MIITTAIVGKIASGTAGGLTAKATLPSVTQSSAGVFALPYLQADRLSSSGGNIFTQTGVMQATLNFTAPQGALELSDDLHISGGMLSMFDGVQICEHGFHLFPENITATPSGSGGSIAAGTYQYAFMFEWMDAFGDVHRSAPSVPISETLSGATSSVAFTIPTLRLTAKTTPISIVIYRTAANQVIFYRLTSITAPLYNSTTADTVSYTDTVADASIIGNEQLYTTGGEVENIAPPAPLILGQYRNRAILIPSENPLTWWYSKQVIQGVPIEWNDAFVQAASQLGGGITGLAELDDKLILFKRDRIFYVVGDGPSPNGQNNDFSEPYHIPAASGCINWRSIALIPDGVMYHSQKGIYLLSRSLQESYIGADVEAYNGQTITGTQIIPQSHQVRFTLQGGTALVYDYHFQQWSVFTGPNAASSTVFQQEFTYVEPTGRVMQEDPNVFTVAGNFQRMKTTSAWISLAGLQGYERAYRLLVLGDYRSPHKLTVSVAYDFNPTPSQVVTIDPGTLLGTPVYGGDATYGSGSPYGGAYPLYQFRLHLQRQKCEALQVSLEEVPTAPYGEGLSLSALALEIGVKRGLQKPAVARSFG